MRSTAKPKPGIFLPPATIVTLYGPKPENCRYLIELGPMALGPVDVRIDGRIVEMVTFSQEKGRGKYTRPNGEEWTNRLTLIVSIAREQIGQDVSGCVFRA